MNTLRRFVRQILGTLLHVGFFVLLSLTILKFAFEDPSTIKTSIANANTYEKFVVSVADSNKEQLKLREDDAANLRTVALKSFAPEVLQAQTEVVIDNFYSWIQGDVPEFTFTVDLSQNRVDFANGLSELVLDRLAFLPICEKTPETVDPFSATCRPEQLDYATEKLSLAAQLTDSPNFLGGMVFDQHTTSKKNGKTLSEQYSFAPGIYKVVEVAPIVLLLYILIIGTLYIYVSKPKVTGLKWLTRDIATSSATVVVAPLVYGYVLPRYTSFIAPSNSGSGTQAIFDSVLGLLTKKIDSITLQVAGVWFVASGLLWLLLRFGTKVQGYTKPPLQSSESASRTKKQKAIRKLAPIQSSEDSSSKIQRALQKKYKKIPKSVK